MIDWITAIIPCHHDEKVYGGTVASINSDGEIEWQVEKKQENHVSYEPNLSDRSLSPKANLIDANPAKWLFRNHLKLFNYYKIITKYVFYYSLHD